MKTKINLITILIALLFIGMQNVNAQATIHVEWEDGASCNCSTAGNAYYSVYVAVFDQCSYPYTTVFQDTNIEDDETFESLFPLTEFCDEETGDCYLVIAEVKKWCPDGHGGYQVECQGKHEGSWYSCQDLMGEDPIYLPLITLDY